MGKCGYAELVNSAENPGILALDRLLWCLGMRGRKEAFHEWYCRTIDELSSGYLAKEPLWSQAAAVGDRQWIEKLAGRIASGQRQIMELPGAVEYNSAVQEEQASYALFTGRRTKDMLLTAY